MYRYVSLQTYTPKRGQFFVNRWGAYHTWLRAPALQAGGHRVGSCSAHGTSKPPPHAERGIPMRWTPVPRLWCRATPALSLFGCILVAGARGLSGQAAAGSSDGAAARAPRVLLAATRQGELRIDGRIDESAWELAPV